MSKPWMPLYVADYLKKTTHLGALESGAYLHLIMDYWANGKLPTDERQLARIARLTDKEWKRVRDTLAAFFDGGWKHKRIDEELARAEEVSCKRRAAALHRHSKSDAIAPANAHTVHSSPSKEEKKEDSGACAPTAGKSKRERKYATALPESFEPNWDAATRVGLSRREAERELLKFKNHAAQTGRTCVSWQAAWSNWCIKAAEFAGRDPPQDQGRVVEISGFYAPFGSPQLDAWDKTKPGGYPRDKAGGWRFPTEWPQALPTKENAA